MTLSADNLVVQGFWQGDFTTMERLCVRSFLANGHDFYLYIYGEVKGVPAGVHLMDANEILPESEVGTFRCAQQFSDAFRVALLLKKGGFYSDLDNCLLKPLDFKTGYVFYRDYDEATISLALSKAPAGAPFLQHCYEFVQSMSPEERSRLSWQEIGSELILGAVEYFKLTDFAVSGRTFDPVHHARVRDLVDPAAKFDLSNSYSVHLFHAAWNSGPEDKTGEGFDLNLPPGELLLTDRTYHPNCLYEQLKRKYNA
jgi:hypothetical protein